MSEMIPPWHRPAAVCAGDGGSRSTIARANHWKRWDAKPEAKGRSSPYARSVAIGKPAETLGRKARGCRANRPMLVRLRYWQTIGNNGKSEAKRS